MEPIETRIGHILDGDNRFLGRSVFDGWALDLVSPTDALMAVLGVRELGPRQREVARVIAICLMSPDARVWPLKLTRLLASHGEPLVGYFGGQLVSAGKLMGPGTGTGAAQGLAWVGAQVGEDPSDETVAQAVAAYRARAGRFSGFGVPFRDQDERRTAALRLAGDGPIAAGRYWRLHLQVVTAMHPLPPNCALTFAAMLLDIGVAAEHVGVAMAALMAHVFLGHALESARQDGARLHTLPAALVAYRGAPPRASGDRQDVRDPSPWTPPAALRLASPREG